MIDTTITTTVECSEPDNHCAVHNPCPAHAADAARYLAEYGRPARCRECGGVGYCPECGTLFMADDPPAPPPPTDNPDKDTKPTTEGPSPL